jgi:undecaprenyl-phosphate galactose phosphotransferase/putative colanic acid biosynthesis UDP-glucose lipid carrier transferase
MLRFSPKMSADGNAGSRLRFSYDALGPLVGLCDAVIIIAFCVAGASTYQLLSSEQIGSVSTYFGIGIVASVAYALIGWNSGLYKFTALLQTRRDYGHMLATWLLVVFLLVAVMFLLKLSSGISRGSFSLFAVMAFVALIAWRKAAKRMVRIALESGAINGRRAILIGTRNELAALRADKLLELFGMKEVARAILPGHDSSDPIISQIEMSAVGSAIEQARTSMAEEVIVALPWGNAAHLDFVREQLRVMPLPVRLMPDRYVRSIWARAPAKPCRCSSIFSARRSPVPNSPSSESSTSRLRRPCCFCCFRCCWRPASRCG